MPPGALVHVRDERGRPLGSALYSSSSQIAIRLLTTKAISEGELSATSARAHRRGRRTSASKNVRDTDSYRVIFSEADLLPGLIVDKYNDVLAMQVLTQAFDRDDLRQVVTEQLAEHFPGSEPARARRSAHSRTGATSARASRNSSTASKSSHRSSP